MSKKSKAKAKLKRLNQKRGRRASRQAQYETFRKLGQNKKSKRFRKGMKDKTVKGIRHPFSDCGNLACIKCFDFSNPWKNRTNSCIFSKRFSSLRWKREQT